MKKLKPGRVLARPQEDSDHNSPPEKKARRIATRLPINGCTASNGYMRGSLRRYDTCNVAMHRQAGNTSLVTAAAAVEHIRRHLEAYPPGQCFLVSTRRGYCTCVCPPGRTCRAVTP